MLQEKRLSDSSKLWQNLDRALENLVVNLDTSRDQFVSEVNRCGEAVDPLGHYARAHYALEARLMEIMETPLLKRFNRPIVDDAANAIAEASLLFHDTLREALEGLCDCARGPRGG